MTIYEIYFNTSHVTVYLQYVIHAEEKHVNFNTSHVTVYRVSFLWGAWGTGISIHLMLRFIGEEYKLPENIKEFQYISCYGLSCNQVDSFIAEYHFNTSHVTVYQKATLY